MHLPATLAALHLLNPTFPAHTAPSTPTSSLTALLQWLHPLPDVAEPRQLRQPRVQVAAALPHLPLVDGQPVHWQHVPLAKVVNNPARVQVVHHPQDDVDYEEGDNCAARD